ncbi:MAG TPA: SOS response-associated peptidase [Methanoregulaceae archaeon]|nr:SOS response-associated peptidase [Methanoregulaceae archaeon]
MCGRYSLICTDDLGNRFRVYEPTLGRRSKFNVAPSQTMPVVVQRERTELVPMEWGLVPHGAKDPAAARRPINARAETLAERPMFRGLLKENRCLVPASGFYEWKRDGGRKAPYYLRLRDTDLFAFAGLYDVWRDPTGNAHPTYTIITTAANEIVAPLHDRMPAILRPGNEDRWLSGGQPAPEELLSLLGPYPAGSMDAYPVSTRMNSPAADDPSLIAPLETWWPDPDGT